MHSMERKSPVGPTERINGTRIVQSCTGSIVTRLPSRRSSAADRQ